MNENEIIAGVLDRAASAYRASLERPLDGDLGYYAGLRKACESPIERVLATAYMTYLNMRFATDDAFPGGRMFNYPIWHLSEPDVPPLEQPGEANFILPQAQVGSFRVDFLVKRFSSPFVDLKPLFETPAVVIECDGHDFHERTKEQAARDRSRDRDLQALGHPVLRFTGSEIWRDPWLCAATIDRFLFGIIDSQFGAMHDSEKRSE